MTTQDLIGELLRVGVRLAVEEGQLRVSAPKGALTPALRERLRERKNDLLDLLSRPSQSSAEQRGTDAPAQAEVAPCPAPA